jgi:adenylyl cyclase-associated protein
MLSKVEIFTAKSSEVNISFPEKDDFVEKPISEQFKTTISNGQVITVPVEHQG